VPWRGIVHPGGGSAPDNLCISGMIAGGYRSPGTWECHGWTVYTLEDTGGYRRPWSWGALEGLFIARRIARGYRKPVRWRAPDVLCSRED
jgi:hypothetical protein